jgi:CheY-like chemotaxis protein
VALLDIGLPQMNGYELAAAVREKVGPKIQLVAMSGYGQPDDVRRAQEAGFDRHLTKPVDPRRLASALRDINLGDRADGAVSGPPA